jgi:hypothetical protein
MSYNQNAECKIRSKPRVGLPSIETACLRLAVTCCHVLTLTFAACSHPTKTVRNEQHNQLLSILIMLLPAPCAPIPYA